MKASPLGSPSCFLLLFRPRVLKVSLVLLCSANVRSLLDGVLRRGLRDARDGVKELDPEPHRCACPRLLPRG
jgi:hypothetical protein